MSDEGTAAELRHAIILAGIAGGIAMFIWSFVPTVLPLGEVGVRMLPNEPADGGTQAF